MFSKSRRGRKVEARWPRIAGWVVSALIASGVLLSGGGRRVMIGLFRRHIRGLTAGIDSSSFRASLADTTGASDPAVARVALTETNEDAVSDSGLPLTGSPAIPTSMPAPPFDRHAIPEEPPLDRGFEGGAAGADRAHSVAADGSTTCPAEFPIKGNGRSGIYHVPGAFAYDRTVPSICFRTPEAAERAGFRAAGSRRS